MRFHYDKKIDALYIRFNENPYVESDEVKDGVIFDYDSRGKIIGIEILDASRKFPRRFKLEITKRKLPLSLVIESGAKVSI
ncbi:MAG: hypothetical protein UV22_C0041G0004 [Parcubacteria group bacterium GW2011_GWA2_42_35]|nr:MAG: hypothetical protein UU96_C0013G0008 [Parcubacteria group bacterium GW2011_GWC2_42_13]KKS55782.1 MAG: hypothetical protein UV22_C0041G0004 [Parcubacteria group bacterium GW2011_GWA2_42_35]